MRIQVYLAPITYIENLKNKVNDLNKENFRLKNILNSFKPLVAGFYIKKEEENNILL